MTTTATPASTPVCSESVSPTPIASAPAASGPITGTISTRPANAPTRIQYGSPTTRNARERRVPTRMTRIPWPRTYAPELEVDQRPGVPDGLPFRAGEQRADQIDRTVALEDPVGRARQYEEDRDQSFERLDRQRQARTDEVGSPKGDSSAAARGRRGCRASSLCSRGPRCAARNSSSAGFRRRPAPG